MLIQRYRGHAAFLDLAPRTRTHCQSAFDYLQRIADTPLIKFDPPLVVRIRDNAATTKGRRQGNYVKSVLSLLFSWGCERGFLATIPPPASRAHGASGDCLTLGPKTMNVTLSANAPAAVASMSVI